MKIQGIWKRFNLEKKSLFNLITGLSYQIISISMGLILPYLFITSLGSEANGLLSSIGQVFTCLGLLEAGVGTTTLQALYKPIAQKDKDEINAILSATNCYYRKTGLWYFLAVIILSIIYPLFINSEITSSTIRWVILLQGTGTVISFLVQAKYNILLRAEGKNYVITILSLALLLARNIGKIIAIHMGYNVIAIQVVQFTTVLVEAVVIYVYVKIKYPWVSVNNRPDFDAIAQKRTVFAQSIAWMIFNHTDILVLTVFTKDLGIVSVYSVYSLLFEAAQNFLNQIRDSFQYKIGSIAQTNKEKLDEYFQNYSIKILMLTLAVYSALYLISVPFISLYTKGVTDADYYAICVPELFFIYKMLYGIRVLNRQLIEANGHFRQTYHIAVIEAILNVMFSVLLVIPFKVQGVLLGSMLSLIISVILYCRYLFTYVARRAIQSQVIFIFVSMPILIGTIIIGLDRCLVVTSWTELVNKSITVGISCLILYCICLRLTTIIKMKVLNHKSH